MAVRRTRLSGLAVVLFVGMGAGSFQASGAAPAVQAIEAGRSTFKSGDLILWYMASGKGPVCLMPSPSWGVSSDMYFRTLKPLESMFTVVYMDARGVGRSAKAKSPAEYTWDHLAGDLEALRVHLKQDKVWLMGHSEGGIEVLQYAVRHPGRVAGMILLNTKAAHDADTQRDVLARAERRRNEPWFPEAMAALQKFPGSGGDQEMAAAAQKFFPLYWADPRRMAPFRADIAASSMSAEAARGAVQSQRGQFDLRSQLGEVAAPALIVTGTDDFICSPEAAKQIHLRLKNSKLLVFEDCGHFPWMEQKDAFFQDVPAFLRALGVR